MAYTDPRTWTTGELVTAALLNTHLRDNLDAGFPTLAVWTDWTPTLVNLTLGNGTQVARYIQIGTTVFGFYSLTLGSTSAVGTAPTISLPVTLAQTMEQRSPIGQAHFLDAGTENYLGVSGWWTTTSMSPQQLGADVKVTIVAISATSPFTWTTNDRMICQFSGEVA